MKPIDKAFLEKYLSGPFHMERGHADLYRKWKRRGLPINKIKITRCRNKKPHGQRTSDEWVETKRYTITWMDGYELEAIEMIHNVQKFAHIQWKQVLIPILGAEDAMKLKYCLSKVIIDTRIFADVAKEAAEELSEYLEDKKIKSMSIIDEYIDG